jgi:enoyl-CoA hydratase
MQGGLKVIVERDGPVTTIIINRPLSRNAVDAETADLLSRAFTAFDMDESAAVAVLFGMGGSFCAGYDLKTLSNGGIHHAPDGAGPMGPTRMLLTKPVIAAIEGHAVAGGLELALFCDLRVASETAVFGVFCRRWGVPLIDGGTVRLPRIVGHGRALDMILTGRAVTAEEALSFGLANRLVPQGEARTAATELAHEIARFPQLCLRSDRLSSYEQWGESLGTALVHEGELGEPALRREAFKGATRFAEGKGRGGSFNRI